MPQLPTMPMPMPPPQGTLPARTLLPRMPAPCMPAPVLPPPCMPAPPAAAGLRRLGSRLARDPRHYQILVLGSLLAYGVFGLDLEVRAGQALAIVAAALSTQLACTLAAGWRRRQAAALAAARFDPKSAAISALSLCLLLRTDRPALAAAAAVLSIAGKFLIRVRGKHVFNPTNFGLVAMMAASRGQVWVSPGQWGSAALFAFLVLCLGGLVVNRAARADVTWAFLAAYGSLLAGRACWLGQPAAIPLHQVASGAFLIFTFFMISDPKTTPDSRAGRILFAVLVALGAGWGSPAWRRWCR
jgi:hypothetical protein